MREIPGKLNLPLQFLEAHERGPWSLIIRQRMPHRNIFAYIRVLCTAWLAWLREAYPTPSGPVARCFAGKWNDAPGGYLGLVAMVLVTSGERTTCK